MADTASDSFYRSDHFQSFFNTSGRSLVLKADFPLFTVMAVSDQYLALTHKRRDEVLNKGLFGVFPGSGADRSEQQRVYGSFKRVIDNKVQDELPTFSYEIYDPGLKKSATQFWSNLNEPLFDAAGEVAYLVNTTRNITGQVLGQREIEEARQFKIAFTTEQNLNERLLVFNENLALDNAQLGIEQQILQDLILQLKASEAKAEQAETILRLAVEAANVGTWYIYCPDRSFRASSRLKELFGFSRGDDVTLEQLIQQITDEYRERVTTMVAHAMEAAGPYDETYAVCGFHDQQLRWVRALGNTSLQADGCLAFTGVVMDITDQKEDELRKNDFISMVSHELKAPLTSLSGYAQILSLRAKSSADTFTAGMLEKMTGQVKKMTGMINGFLSRGHLESGKIHLEFSEFALEELVGELVDEARLIAVNHIIAIGHCDGVRLYADRDKIGNVISNLLSNAIKYSPSGKNITVSCMIKDDRIQVSVQDEGMGIKANDMAGLFERYQRVKTAYTEKIAGFGIGLYLSAEIVRRHKGKIWVESEPGAGSVFYFDLPVLPRDGRTD